MKNPAEADRRLTALTLCKKGNKMTFSLFLTYWLLTWK